MDGSDQEPLLTVEHVTKSFGGVQAMRDGSFDLKRSEVVAIVGGNGAGKSTLAKIVSGAHVPDGGRIKIKGVEVKRADHSVSSYAGLRDRSCVPGPRAGPQHDGPLQSVPRAHPAEMGHLC